MAPHAAGELSPYTTTRKSTHPDEEAVEPNKQTKQAKTYGNLLSTQKGWHTVDLQYMWLSCFLSEHVC